MKSCIVFLLSLLIGVFMWLLFNLIILSIGWPVMDDWYWYDNAQEAVSIALLWLCIGCSFWMVIEFNANKLGGDL